jgi:hypothetical protein
MARTFANLLTHVIFSTKDREVVKTNIIGRRHFRKNSLHS